MGSVLRRGIGSYANCSLSCGSNVKYRAINAAAQSENAVVHRRLIVSYFPFSWNNSELGEFFRIALWVAVIATSSNRSSTESVIRKATGRLQIVLWVAVIEGVSPRPGLAVGSVLRTGIECLQIVPWVAVIAMVSTGPSMRSVLRTNTLDTYKLCFELRWLQWQVLGH